MVQFYFLSILFNAIAGCALIVDPDAKAPSFEGIRAYLLDETFRLVVGVMTMATGFFKLLSAVRGDIPVAGDLFPALAGLFAGTALIFEFYRSRSALASETMERFELVFVKNRKWFGYCAIGAAIAHFLFPTVLFL